MRARGIGDIKRARSISALRNRVSKQSQQVVENIRRTPRQLKYEKSKLQRKLEQIEQQRAVMEKNLSDIAQLIRSEISWIEELEKEVQETSEEQEMAEKGAEAEEQQPEAAGEVQQPETAQPEQVEPTEAAEEQPPSALAEVTGEQQSEGAEQPAPIEGIAEEQEEQPEVRGGEQPETAETKAEKKQPEAEGEEPETAEEEMKEEQKPSEIEEKQPEEAGENEQKKKVELNFGLGKFSFSDVFQGVGSVIDLVSRMAEEKEERREGEFASPSGRVKAVYGFSIHKGLGGKPSVEPFGNVKRTTLGPVVEEERQPLVDVLDEKDHVVVIVELPGIDGRQVHTEVKGDILILSAASGDRKYASEIVLPEGVDASTLTSKYKNGILELKMNKG